jgi:hypothetical protein
LLAPCPSLVVIIIIIIFSIAVRLSMSVSINGRTDLVRQFNGNQTLDLLDYRLLLALLARPQLTATAHRHHHDFSRNRTLLFGNNFIAQIIAFVCLAKLNLLIGMLRSPL